jgi:hypothetical protein
VGVQEVLLHIRRRVVVSPRPRVGYPGATVDGVVATTCAEL